MRTLPLLASAANLVTNDASAVSELGPKFAAICLRIVSSLTVACLAASAKTSSVSTFASSIASSTPEPRCCGVAVSAAGADDDDAAADAFAVGPSICGCPCGVGLRCVCGSPRVDGRAVCVRGGPRVDCCGTVGGFTNACPWYGPGCSACVCARLPVPAAAAALTACCCTCCFAICSLSFSRSKNSASS